MRRELNFRGVGVVNQMYSLVSSVLSSVLKFLFFYSPPPPLIFPKCTDAFKGRRT